MDNRRIVCLVAAAGRGLRFGRELPKSFYPVEGKTLLARSIESIDAREGIDRFIVMVPSGWEDKASQLLAGELDGVKVKVVAGGETRQESVEIGLGEAAGAEIVLIHDACRPFVSPRLVDRVIEEAGRSGAAVPVLQATDTLGRMRGEELESIVPRDRVVAVQTPQGFRKDILEEAYKASREVIKRSTDESSILLAAGIPVKVVEGERWNIKVTVKEDLEIISSFLAGRKLDLG